MICLLPMSIIFIIAIIYIYFSEKSKVLTTKNDFIPIPEEEYPKVIVTFKGSEYDITNFIKRHPGGKQILLDNNGKDIEELMLANEHSSHAYQLLERYKIN